MIQQWLSELPLVPNETPAQRLETAHREIWQLNGKPTIHQMARLVDLVTERGGRPQSPIEYNAAYQARLATVVNNRAEQVRQRRATADEFMVAGARSILHTLQALGVTLHLASGTELRFISAEAELLQLSTFFGPRFHGPSGPDDRHFSKRGVMDQILRDHGIPGHALVAFGDGHVEIEEARAVGGFAVAVCSDESRWRSGELDPVKFTRLKGAGAHFCIPDFSNPAEWLARLPMIESIGVERLK